MSYDGITSGRDSEFFDPEKFSIGNPTKLIWKSDVQCGAISYISFWDGYYWLYHIEWLWSLVFMFDLGSCGVPFLLTEGGWVEPAEDSSRTTLNMGVRLNRNVKNGQVSSTFSVFGWKKCEFSNCGCSVFFWVNLWTCLTWSVWPRMGMMPLSCREIGEVTAFFLALIQVFSKTWLCRLCILWVADKIIVILI